MKVEGNNALAGNNFDEALRLYTEALTLDDRNAVLYSNRSAAYSKAGNYLKALEDAEKTIEMRPDWIKVSLCVISWAVHSFNSTFLLVRMKASM